MTDELDSSEDFSEVRLSKKMQYKIKNICVFIVKQKSACLVCFCLFNPPLQVKWSVPNMFTHFAQFEVILYCMATFEFGKLN